MSAFYKETNSETSIELFDKKVIYDSDILKYAETYANIINFNFGEKFMYGRVGRNFIPIQVADGKSLKGFSQTSLASRPMVALNFVVDAFNAMALQFTKCAAIGKIDPDDPYLSSLLVYKAYENPERLYTTYKNGYFSGLMSSFSGNKVNVKDFGHFVNKLEEMIELPTKAIPLTKPAFVKSRRCPITVSGLAIEIADLDASNDDEKVNAFINSRNWEFYVNACRSYGFMIDSAMPWRLVADIGSSAMLEYAAKYDFSKTDLILWGLYEYSHISYFQGFKVDLLSLYDMSKPKTIIETEECNGKTITNLVKPKKYSITTLKALFSETYFLKLYFRIRLLEDESVFTEYEQASLIRDCIQIYNSQGINRSLRVFETIVNKPFDYRGSLSYNVKRIQALADSE